MATKVTWRIEVIQEATSKLNIWKISNLLNSNVYMFPATQASFQMEVSSSSDYNFIWNKNLGNEFQVNVLDIRYIGGSTSAPNYGSPSTDLASILALLN